ncbi:hypothetical protein [Mesorhizobium sp.]|uniref:hypothetical protein n=1 Tax=Mesorhizobium sp. TaxID=1871066 RepID=UPI0025E7D733|nr:hypothetical protein [Mesorhizobium sp.]
MSKPKCRKITKVCGGRRAFFKFREKAAHATSETVARHDAAYFGGAAMNFAP